MGCTAACEPAAEEVLSVKQQGANFRCPGQQAERSITLQSWVLDWSQRERRSTFLEEVVVVYPAVDGAAPFQPCPC